MRKITIGPSFRLFEQQDQIPETDRKEVLRILEELKNRSHTEGILTLLQDIPKINKLIVPYGYRCAMSRSYGHFYICLYGPKIEAPKLITEELEDYPYHLEIIVEGTTCDIYLVMQDLPATHFYRAFGVSLKAVKELESIGLEYYLKYYQRNIASTLSLNSSVMVGKKEDLERVMHLLSKKYDMKKM